MVHHQIKKLPSYRLVHESTFRQKLDI